jgi:hypothetical protein
MYTFLIKNFAGTEVTEVFDIPFERIRLVEELNVGVSGSVSVNFLALKRYADKLLTDVDSIIGNVYKEWYLYKDSSLLYGGVLTDRQLNGSKAQATSLTIGLTGFEGLLSNRVTGEKDVFSSDDSSDIAWSLISTSQAKTYGNYGITRGLNPTTVDRDRTYRFEYIRKAIEKMSSNEVYNGFDWEITAQKVFNVYYPKGEVKPNIVLDDFNIISWQDNKPLTGRLANRAYVIGEGQEDAILFTMVEDTTPQETWYLQEVALSHKDIKTVATLEDKGNKYLDKYKEPKRTINLVVNDKNPDVVSYNVGDSLKVIINSIAFNETLRVKSKNFDIKKREHAIINLTFDYE